jgi:DNA-binding CsgD family transcriptional regulator
MATVFISDPEASLSSPDEIARRVYGLSAAESRVARALVDTGGLERAADQLGISRETARWHLKRIYRKTGTNRQPALVRRLAQVPSRLTLPAR